MTNRMKKAQQVFLWLLFAGSVCSVSGADLVVRYSFDNAADIGHDDSGNGLDLSVYGVEPVYSETGKIGGSASFDGSTQGFFTPPGVMPIGSFTLALWAESDVWPAMITRGFGSKGAGMQIYGSWYTEYAFATLYSTGATYGRPRYRVPFGQWQHLALTFEATSGPDENNDYTGTLKGYIDGEVKVTVADAKYNASVEHKMCIGRYGTLYFDGRLDEYRIYKGALTESEIQTLAGRTVEN